MPNSSLPPDRWSTVVAIFASRTGCRYVFGHQASDARPFCRFGHRGLQGPALVDRPVWATATDGREVVEIPDVVESSVVGDAPHGSQRFDGRVLA